MQDNFRSSTNISSLRSTLRIYSRYLALGNLNQMSFFVKITTLILPLRSQDAVSCVWLMAPLEQL